MFNLKPTKSSIFIFAFILSMVLISCDIKPETTTTTLASTTTTTLASTTTTTTTTTIANRAPVVNAIGQSQTNNVPTQVWATVSDADGLSNISSVKIKQSVSTSTTYFIYTLYDDGTHGDAVANDGKFTYSFVDGVDQRYYTTTAGHLYTVTATDKKGATGTKTW